MWRESRRVGRRVLAGRPRIGAQATRRPAPQRAVRTDAGGQVVGAVVLPASVTDGAPDGSAEGAVPASPPGQRRRIWSRSRSASERITSIANVGVSWTRNRKVDRLITATRDGSTATAVRLRGAVRDDRHLTKRAAWVYGRHDLVAISQLDLAAHDTEHLRAHVALPEDLVADGEVTTVRRVDKDSPDTHCRSLADNPGSPRSVRQSFRRRRPLRERSR